MRTDKEILERIDEILPDLEVAETTYFSIVASKQNKEFVETTDFLKIESEYEILKKEFDTLLWALNREEEK